MKTIAQIFVICSFFMINNHVNSKDLVGMRGKLEFLDSMNTYRAELGLKKVWYSVEVEALAKIRTKTIYNHLKRLTQREYKKNYRIHLHEGFGMDALSFTAGLTVKRSKYNAAAISENVCHFAGYTDRVIPLSFEGWKNSPSHWEAMMEEDIDHISLHYEESDIGIIAVMILFIKSMNR